MKLMKRQGLWYVRFTDAAGRDRRLSTGVRVGSADDARQAQVRALDLMREVVLEDASPRERAAMRRNTHSLESALETAWRDRWSAQSSAKEKRYVVTRLQVEIGDWPLHTVSYTRLMDYCKAKLAGDSPATRNRKMSCVSTALREAVKRGELQLMPLVPHFTEAAIKDRYLSDEEERTVLEDLKRRGLADAYGQPGTGDWIYFRVLVPFLLDTGLRLTEALNLTVGNVGREFSTITLASGTTKNGKGRTVPLTPRASAALRAMLGLPLHGKVDANWAGRRWRTVMEATGIEGVCLHTLRHTCASRLVQRGLDLYRVSKWLGHSSLEVTQRYAHLAADDLTAGAALLCQQGDSASTAG